MGGRSFKVMTESVDTSSPLNLKGLSVSLVPGAEQIQTSGQRQNRMHCWGRVRDTDKRGREPEKQRKRKKGLYHALSPKLTHQIAPLHPLETNESEPVSHGSSPLPHISPIMKTWGSTKRDSLITGTFTSSWILQEIALVLRTWIQPRCHQEWQRSRSEFTVFQ